MDLQIVLMTVIAFSAFMSVLSFIFHWLLSPLKENQARLEIEIKEVKTDIKQLLSQSIK